MDVAAMIKVSGLKATTSRVNIVHILGNSHEALSHTALEIKLPGTDRVTLYRGLNDLEKAGIVHKIVDLNGTARFAISKRQSNMATHHAHFSCGLCHKLFCLEEVVVPALNIPEGFTAAGSNTMVYGYCNNCKTE